MQLVSGQNTALSGQEFLVELAFKKGPALMGDIDPSAFMLTKADKVRGDDDFIFYNQPESADSAVVFEKTPAGGIFRINTVRLDAAVEKVAFTMVIDGASTIAHLLGLSLTIPSVASFDVPLEDRSEKAVIMGHLYRHNGGWKLKALGQGFNGGLAPLATSFGVVVEEEAAAPAPTPSKPKTEPAPPKPVSTISLEKVIAAKAPALVSLVKPVQISLQKHKLESVKAKVAFVLDASGSMTQQFKGGNVQAVLERIAVLSVQFDDDGSMDLWGFGKYHKKYPDVSLANLKGYIDKLQKTGSKGMFEILPSLGGINNEPPVMEEVIETFKDSMEPVFVVFITDGGINQTKEIKKAIKRSADYPIFWKFVGLGGGNYGVLEKLDTFTDRAIDNTHFFSIDDFKTMSDAVLYDNLLAEFSPWLSGAKTKGIVKI